MTRIDFKQTWGYSCNQLAEMEGVTPEAIRMRVTQLWYTFSKT